MYKQIKTQSFFFHSANLRERPNSKESLVENNKKIELTTKTEIWLVKVYAKNAFKPRKLCRRQFWRNENRSARYCTRIRRMRVLFMLVGLLVGGSYRRVPNLRSLVPLCISIINCFRLCVALRSSENWAPIAYYRLRTMWVRGNQSDRDTHFCNRIGVLCMTQNLLLSRYIM